MSRRIITVAINENDLSLIRHIESATIINNAPGAGYDPEGHGLPLGREEAQALIDPEGFAEVVVSVPLETFGQGLAGDSSQGEDDIYDILHEIAFGQFGVSEDSAYEVLGVESDSSSLIVQYTTHLAPFRDEGDET